MPTARGQKYSVWGFLWTGTAQGEELITTRLSSLILDNWVENDDDHFIFSIRYHAKMVLVIIGLETRYWC